MYKEEVFLKNAFWIEDPAFNEGAPCFKRDFQTVGRIGWAKLQITGLGYFHAELNGIPLDEYLLKPNVTIYDERPLNGILDYFFNKPKTTVYYLEYDLTDKLLPFNTLKVTVGNGWYHHIEKECEGNFNYGNPKCIFALHWKDEGGEKFVYSDENTLVRPSEIVANTLFKGEVLDCRMKEGARNQAPYQNAVLAKPPTGELLLNPAPCDKIRNVLRPVLKYSSEGVTVYDFGKNHSGVVNIVAEGKSGSEITVTYGENIKDGKLDHYSTSWGIQIQTDKLILGGKEVTWHPLFTFHGYRYAEVRITGSAKIKEITSLEINADIPVTSEFECSDEIICGIHKMYINTQLSNLHGGFPSDCPHREKRGFLGDGQVTADAALTDFDIKSTYIKWIKDMIDCQDVSGFVPHTAPFSGGGGGPLYGSAIGIVPWAVYYHTLDKKPLETALQPLYKWIKYLDTRHNGDYLVTHEEKGWCLGDWFCPKSIDISPVYANTCAFFLSCDLYLKMSKVLDKTEHTSEIEILKDKIRKIINEKFYDKKTCNYDYNRNGANIFAVMLGIVENSEKQKVVDSTLKYYSERPEINTGIMGTKLLFPFLTEYGGEEIAYKILRRREYPSYGYMLDSGATTLWECFEKDISPDFKISETERLNGYPVSHNHPMFGSIDAWFFSDLAGINISRMDEGVIIIEPKLTKYVEWVKAKRMTPFGGVSVRYYSENNVLSMLEVVIPENLKGKAILPDGKVFGIESGSWKWRKENEKFEKTN